MAGAIIAIGFMTAVQLLCILKGRKKIVKALPPLIGLLLMGMFLMLMAWSFSFPDPVSTAELYQQEDRFALFFAGFWLGVVSLAGGTIGWLIYGVVLFFQRRENKTGKSELNAGVRDGTDS